MPSVNRISVTTASATHQKLLEYEAVLTGRSISSLCSSLLEEIVNQKLQAGQLHPTAIRLAEDLIKCREGLVVEDHKSAIATITDEGVWHQIHSAQKIEEAEEQGLVDGAWIDFRDVQPKGFFTDGTWAQQQPAEPAVDPREAELVAYGMRYGLGREEAEDIYERFSHAKRHVVREYMREAAGVTERLPEGESIATNNDEPLF